MMSPTSTSVVLRADVCSFLLGGASLPDDGASSAYTLTEAPETSDQQNPGRQAGQHVRPAPLQLPESDCQPGSSEGPSPMSSTDITAVGSPPQGGDLDPQLMLCNPLYSMASLRFRGDPSAPGSESSFPEAVSSAAAAAAQPCSAVSLCSSPADTCAVQPPPRSMLLPKLAAHKAWPPRLAIPGSEAGASCDGTATLDRQTASRHAPAPSEGDSSAWFAAAAAHSAGSCVSSPRAAAMLQQNMATGSEQAEAAAPAALARSIAEPPQPLMGAQDCSQAAWRDSECDAAASVTMDAASQAGEVPRQARGKRPWRPRPPPPPSSCASNRPLKSSGPFFPPAARFVPSTSARSVARSAFADPDAGIQAHKPELDVASSEQPQQQQHRQQGPWTAGGAEGNCGEGEGGDRLPEEGGRSWVDDCSTPDTMIVKGEEADAHVGWSAHLQGEQMHVLREEAEPPQLQKENSASPEQRLPAFSTVLKPGRSETQHMQQPRAPVSPLQERNSPDAAAHFPQQLVAQSLSAPGSRHLPGQGPLATSSPAIVRAANRQLRSGPEQLRALVQAVPHANAQAGLTADAEVSLASPLRRSMQWASQSSQQHLPPLPEAQRTAGDRNGDRAQPANDRQGKGLREEPQSLAMLRSSGILQRDGPLAASGAAALARASAPQPPVSLRRPHPADLEAAERLRVSLSSEGGSSSRASSEPLSRSRLQQKQEPAQEEGALRASGGTQAPSTPKHAPRPSALPDSPLTCTSSGARSATPMAKIPLGHMLIAISSHRPALCRASYTPESAWTSLTFTECSIEEITKAAPR